MMLGYGIWPQLDGSCGPKSTEGYGQKATAIWSNHHIGAAACFGQCNAHGCALTPPGSESDGPFCWNLPFF